MRQSELLAVRRAAMALGYQVDEKRIAGCSKRVRAEAREKSASGGVLSEYVVARRSSATKDMSRFQQPASDYANFAEVNIV